MKKSPEQVLAELTGDRTADHFAIRTEAVPCACESDEDHDYGMEEN